ncbi:unnamed protein product [Caenorhabditis angaria]|uniref:Sdz-33 F-box domain-containing protein n=1 Tax=Caenorhabditis angaria TaxID=860376 RepID=A0A9P1MY62_9PELO|nr:unnamed protein product [Caenorhabditis angaria]
MSWRILPFELKLMVFDYLDDKDKMNLAACSTDDLEDFFNSISCIKSVHIANGELDRIETRNWKRYFFNSDGECLLCWYSSGTFYIESKKTLKMIQNYRKKVLMSNYTALYITGYFPNVEEIANLSRVESLTLCDVSEDVAVRLLSKTDNRYLRCLDYASGGSSYRISECELIYKIDNVEFFGVEFTDEQFLKFESRKIVIENNGKITQNGINKFIENWSKNKERENFKYFIINGEMTLDEPKWEGSQNYVKKRDHESYVIENQWNEQKKGLYSKNGGYSVMFRVDFD